MDGGDTYLSAVVEDPPIAANEIIGSNGCNKVGVTYWISFHIMLSF